MLVSIVKIAEDAELVLRATSKPGQFRTNCPFCGDDAKHLHLYINADRDVFFCQRCTEKGGATALYAKLHNITFASAKEILYPPKENKPKRKMHPAETLSPADLKKIGFQSKPNKKPSHMSDYDWAIYRRRQLEWIWKAWNERQSFLRRIQFELRKAELKNQTAVAAK